MKTAPGLVLTALLCAGCADGPDASPQLDYTLTPVPAGVEVALSMTGEADGETALFLGRSYGSHRAPHEFMSDVRVEGADATRDDGVLTLRHVPGAEMTIRYVISAIDSDAAPDNHAVSPDLIHLLGYAALAVPQSDAAYEVSLRFENIPDGWATIASPGLSGSRTARDMLASVMIAGPVDVTRDGDIEVALHGDWGFAAADLAEDIAPLIAAQQEMWEERDAPFTVAISAGPDTGAGSSISGTGLFQAFSARGTPRASRDDVQGFLAHEIAHNWIPNRFGQPTGPRGELYWFTEGMTEFAAQQARLAAGVMNAQGYADKINRDLRELTLSPARNMTNASAAAAFWDNPDAERIPYLRGFLLAAKWDAELKENGRPGLMDVFVDMAARNTAADDPVQLTPELITDTLREAGVEAPARDLRDWVLSGGDITPPPGLAGECFAPRSVEVRPYDVGFDVEATFATGRVVGVVEGHNAARAGLRDGVVFVGKVSGGRGATDRDIVLEVETAETGPREISYRPVGPQAMSVPQFVAEMGCTP